MSLYACVIIRENYVFLSLSANFSRYDIHHLNKATSPVPASLSRASSGPSSEEVNWLKWRFWSSHQTLSHLHHRQALYSVTPEIRWCTFKANGNGGEIGTGGVCCQSPRLWQREEKHTVDFLIIQNQMALLRVKNSLHSTQFPAISFCVCAAVQPVVREAILCLWVNSPSPKPTYALAYSDAPRDQAVVLSEIRDL